MKRRLSILVILFCSIGIYAGVYTPQDVPNLHSVSVQDYVSNPDAILSPAAVAELNRLSCALYKRAEVELVVVAIDAMNDDSQPVDFAQTLFNAWGIGKEGKNTGVLILLVRDSRDIRIHTGGGMEGLLPDGVCSDIIQTTMIPRLSNGDYDGGIIAGAEAIIAKTTTDEALQELLLGYRNRPSKLGLYVSYYFTLAFFVLILLAFAAYRELNGNTNLPKNIRYRHARTNLYRFRIAAIFFPFPCALFLWWYRKQIERIRTSAMLCPECHNPMRRLSENEEDTYLNDAEQSEERVKSIDYDVWLCPSCFNHIILPYEAERTQYSRCPYCHAKTYAVQSNIITRQPTATSKGIGQKTYHCKHCGKTTVQTYTIPCQPVVVVAPGRGGGSHGGFSGGSFGGGVSFGGGAGGKF